MSIAVCTPVAIPPAGSQRSSTLRDEMRDALVRISDTVRRLPLGLFTPAPFGLPHGLVGEVRSELEGMLPRDSHERCSGRLHVGVTWVANAPNDTGDRSGDSGSHGRGFGLVSDFPSRETLVDAVIASCFIPAITGPLIGAPFPRVGGAVAIDGGLTRNWPAPPGAHRTVYISPIPGPDFDVCPVFNPNVPNFPAQPRPWDASCEAGDSVRVALDPTVLPAMLLQIFRAPSPAIIDALIERGQDDAERFASSEAAANLQ